MDLEQRIATGHEMVNNYIKKHNIVSTMPDNINVRNLASKSYPDMLIEIAKQSDGILNKADVVNILLQANVGTKKQIQHNLDTALSRLRDHFKRIGRGQYQFTNHLPRKRGERSGLREALMNLKQKNPQITAKEALEHLIASGFDFKGKRATSAVNLTWGYLGYSKENKQQPLPLNPLAVPVEHILASNN